MIPILAMALAAVAVAVAASPDDEFVSSAKAYLTRNFNDPESAHYRDLYIGTDSDGKPVLCGEVNARNGAGGMSGYQAFFSKPGEDAYWAGMPREFIERGGVGREYVRREGAKCRKPGKPVS